MGDKIRILFLAANPADVKFKLRLDREVSEIEDRIIRAQYRDEFELVSKWSAQLETIQQFLLEYKPQILHFSGHGQEGGSLAFEDRSGNLVLLDPKVFAELIKELKDNIRLVLLNACHSRDQVEFLKDTVDYAIGMNRPITDNAAKVFAAYFYQALAFGRSVQSAFSLGLIQLKSAGISGSDIPELLVREGADATKPLFPDRSPQEDEAPVNKSELIIEGEEFVADKAANITNVEYAGEPGEMPLDGNVNTILKVKKLKAEDINIRSRYKHKG